MLNALDAAERGAVIRTRTRCTRAERRDEWELVLNDRGRREVATARVLVNAAGPWIGEVADTVIRQPLARGVRLIKGSHIVVRRRFEHDCGYILQAPTGAWCSRCRSRRISRLIGTTDENFVGDLNSPPRRRRRNQLSVRRRESNISAMSSRPTNWSGRSPACARSTTTAPTSRKTSPATTSSCSTSRDGEAPLLTIYGGKITTYRRLAEAALARIGRFFGASPALDRAVHAARRRIFA